MYKLALCGLDYEQSALCKSIICSGLCGKTKRSKTKTLEPKTEKLNSRDPFYYQAPECNEVFVVVYAVIRFISVSFLL